MTNEDITMNDTDINPFDARWLNCLYGGKLSGRAKVVTDAFIFIEPLLDITLQDGSKVRKFFAPRWKCKVQLLQKDDYVIFEWERVGERSYDRRRDTEGDPEAFEVEVVSKEMANELARQLKSVLPEMIRRRWNDCVSDLEQKKQSIDLQVEELAQSLITELQQEIDLERIELQKKEKFLNNRHEELELCLQSIEQKSDSLAQREEAMMQLSKELEPYKLAVPINIKEPTSLDSDHLPESMGINWQIQLQNDGLYVSKNIANSYLISLLSGFYSGALVLLNGSVGVGKTSIVKYSAKLLDGSSSIIPVRPAWLEPADLFGFFDPIHEIFRPTSFLTALKDTENDRDKLNLICLDELNLAKIENYASDLLSKLEYSRETDDSSENSLQLFSGDIENELWNEVRYLNEQEHLDPKQRARQQRLRLFLSNQRSRQPIPKNLVLLGTLNSDETTYDLSPKVIDRSLTISYPIADFSNMLTSNLDPKTFTKSNVVSTSKLRKVLDKLYEDNFNTLKQGRLDGWEHIKDWNEDYMSSSPYLGIPLGYRTMKDYAVFHSVGIWLGFGEEEILGHFLFTKMLPRVSFSKDDQTTKLFQRWLEELKQNYKNYDPANILDRLERQLNDKHRQTVRYWG